MKLTTLTLALSLVMFTAACGKKDEAKGGAAGKTAESGKAAPAGGAPTMSAPDLFADYNKPGQDGMALMKKWQDGVVVNGEVTNVITEEAGNASVWLSTGATGKLSLGFTDEGKAAKEKGVKASDKVTAKCKIGGSDGNLMMLTDCVLQ